MGIAARRSRLGLGILRLSLLLIVLFRPVCGVGRLHLGEHLLLSRLRNLRCIKSLARPVPHGAGRSTLRRNRHPAYRGKQTSGRVKITRAFGSPPWKPLSRSRPCCRWSLCWAGYTPFPAYRRRLLSHARGAPRHSVTKPASALWAGIGMDVLVSILSASDPTSDIAGALGRCRSSGRPAGPRGYELTSISCPTLSGASEATPRRNFCRSNDAR